MNYLYITIKEDDSISITDQPQPGLNYDLCENLNHPNCEFYIKKRTRRIKKALRAEIVVKLMYALQDRKIRVSQLRQWWQ